MSEWLLAAGSGGLRNHVANYHDRISIPAHSMGLSDGNVVHVVEAGRAVAQFSGSQTSTVGITGGWDDLLQWTTFDVKVRWFPQNASNVVSMIAGYATSGPGDTIAVGDFTYGSQVNYTLTSASQHTETTLLSGIAVPAADEVLSIVVGFLGADAADTDTGSRNLMAVLLEKAS